MPRLKRIKRRTLHQVVGDLTLMILNRHIFDLEVRTRLPRQFDFQIVLIYTHQSLFLIF